MKVDAAVLHDTLLAMDIIYDLLLLIVGIVIGAGAGILFTLNNHTKVAAVKDGAKDVAKTVKATVKKVR